VYIVTFYLVSSVFLAMYHNYINKTYYLKHGLINIFQNEAIRTSFLLFAAFHAIMLLGAIAFKKMHFLKTCFILFLSYLFLLLINRLILQAMTGQIFLTAHPFMNLFRLVGDGQTYEIKAGHFYSQLSYSTLILITLILWVAAYFKLKEKQV
jgi:hypothetical protein